METLYPYVVAVGFGVILSIVWLPVGVIFAAVVGPAIIMLQPSQVAAIGIASLFFASIGRLTRSTQKDRT